MQVWNVLHVAHGKYRTQKSSKIRHLGTIALLCRAISSQLRHISTIGKQLVKQQYLPHMSLQYGELWPTSAWDLLASLGHPSKFQQVSRLGSVTAQHSSSGRQPNFAALNRGRQLYSAGRPLRWALAHILVPSKIICCKLSLKFCSLLVINYTYNTVWSTEHKYDTNQKILGINSSFCVSDALLVIQPTVPQHWGETSEQWPQPGKITRWSCFSVFSTTLMRGQWWLSGGQEGKLSGLFCAILCAAIVHSELHTHMNRLTVLWIGPGYCLTGPISLRIDSFLCMYYFVSDCTLHACVLCSIVTWWAGPGGIEAWFLGPLLPSLLWHCWLGHLTRKTRPRYDL